MPSDNPFKWRQFEPGLILLCVRWYLRYAVSYRDLEEMMRERGLCSTIRRSIDGCSAMRQRSTSGAGHS